MNEEAGFLMEKATPRAEQSRSAYGSLLMSAQTVQGLCALGRKCVRKDGHKGDCWPGD